MKDRLKTLAAFALVCAVILVFFRETVFQGRSLVPTDIVHELMLPFAADKAQPSVQNHFAVDAVIIDIGWARLWQETVFSGQLPLWNPSIYAGHPVHAESWPATLSPFKLLYLVLPLERAFSLGIVLELGLATLLMWAFLRELGLSRWAAVFGATAYGLNSQFLMWYWRVPSTFAWAPLGLLLSERAFARDSRAYALGSGLVLGVAFLCGSIQASFHLGFLCLGWFCGALFWRDGAGARRFLAHGALIFLVAALVSAAQWLPTLELMRLDAYGDVGSRGPLVTWRQVPLQLLALVTFAFPAITGSTESYDLLKAAGANRLDFTGYVGLLGLAMALVGAGSRQSARPVRALLAVVGAVFFLLFLTPWAKFLYHRFFVVVVFAAAVFAAYGLDAIRGGDPRSVRWAARGFRWLLAGALALALGLCAAQVVVHVKRPVLEAAGWKRVQGSEHSASLPHRADWFRARVGLLLDHYRVGNPAFAIPLGVAFLAAAAWFAARRGWLRAAFLAPGLVLLNAVDLVGTGRAWVPQVSLERYPLVPSHPVLSIMRAERERGRVARLGENAHWIMAYNFLMPCGLDDAQGNSSITPENALVMIRGKALPRPELLDLANVRFVLTLEDLALPSDRYELKWKGDGIRLYRNPSCLPRLQFISEPRVIPGRQEAVEFMRSGEFDPRTTVVLEKEPGSGERRAGSGERAEADVRKSENRKIEKLGKREIEKAATRGGERRAGSGERAEGGNARKAEKWESEKAATRGGERRAGSGERAEGENAREAGTKLRIVEDTPLRVACEVEVPVAGFVLLADTFYPGWKAFLDGREVEIYRADRCFRAVRVDAGRHELSFRFEPRSFRVGLGLGVLGLGMVGVGLAWRGGGGRKAGA